MAGFFNWVSVRLARVTLTKPAEPWQKQPSIFWVQEFGLAGVARQAKQAKAARQGQQWGAWEETQPASTSRPVPPRAAEAKAEAKATTTRQRVLGILRDFVDNAYISGVSLAGRADIPLWDRLFWVSVVLVALGLVIREFPVTYRRLYEHPSTVEVLSTSLELHTFPFPAVVVCPQMKIRKRAAIEYIMRANRLQRPNETLLLPALRMLQNYRLPYWLDRGAPDIDRSILRMFDAIDLRDFMDHVALDCKSIFAACLWSGTFVDCCSIFTPTMSNAGVCYAFNSYTTRDSRSNCPLIHPNERPLESGASIWYFHRPNKIGCVLVRSSGTASGSGLEFLLLQSDPLDSVAPPGKSLGYEISVQAANENADMDKGVSLSGNPGTVTAVKVTYSETTADPWMAGLPPEQRRCLFEDEKPKELFDHIATAWYTQETCMFACRLDFLVRHCGCYPFLITKKDEQCSLEQYKCLIDLNERLFWVRLPEEIGTTPEERNHSLWPDCRACLSMCSLSIYEAEYLTDRSPNLFTAASAGFVNVFYRDLHSAIKYSERRDKEPFKAIMTYTASMNLLLGVSLMSVVQLVMYTVEVALALSRPLWTRLADFQFEPKGTIEQQFIT
ncbi:pickpocket protein 19-like [Thrips palmi]|uniref:Pickpocket protein 19-like n=1 Tax=Thrips palmi TaxID=161013 RepID=A0A6P8YJB7_THRPL|nr:pickpocket protein 19-like [Thrips palmi]